MDSLSDVLVSAIPLTFTKYRYSLFFFLLFLWYIYRLRNQEDKSQMVVRYSENAPWAELSGHCEKEHPMAFEALSRMSPTQIMEMKQQMGFVNGR